jgi:hypothetical protein
MRALAGITAYFYGIVLLVLLSLTVRAALLVESRV